MKVSEVLLSTLKPYENNPRINENAVDSVANSIKEFGFLVPIVVDSNNTIVCGHTRYKAAEKLGMSSVPCVMAEDLTPEQVKAFRIVDNKTSELSSWNFENLSFELEDLKFDQDFEFNFEDFGFKKEEIRYLDGSAYEEEMNEEPEEPKFQMFHPKVKQNEENFTKIETENPEFESENQFSNKTWLEKGIEYTELMMNTRRIVIEYTEEDIPFLQDFFKMQALKPLIKVSDLKKASES